MCHELFLNVIYAYKFFESAQNSNMYIKIHSVKDYLFRFDRKRFQKP